MWLCGYTTERLLPRPAEMHAMTRYPRLAISVLLHPIWTSYLGLVNLPRPDPDKPDNKRSVNYQRKHIARPSCRRTLLYRPIFRTVWFYSTCTSIQIVCLWVNQWPLANLQKGYCVQQLVIALDPVCFNAPKMFKGEKKKSHPNHCYSGCLTRLSVMKSS